MSRSPHRGWYGLGSPAVRSKSFRQRSRSAAERKLEIEVLEQRMMLATDIWINPAGGDWGTPGDWSTSALPGPGDDVVINSLDPGASVTHSQNSIDIIHSLTAGAPITLSGGKLDVSGGSGTAGALSDSSPFTVAGGTLSLANVQVGTALTASNSSGEGTLDRLTLGGSLSVLNAGISVTGGLTLANGAAPGGGCESQRRDRLHQRRDRRRVWHHCLGPRGQFVAALRPCDSGSGVTVHGLGGHITVVSGSLTNQGTIDADGGGTITILDNQGTSWTNASGGILKADGGTLSLSGTWSNDGQIVVNNSVLNLGGSFTTAGLGSYTRSGGSINLAGSLDNTGATLVLDAATGSWNLRGGTLKGGTLATLDGTALAATGNGGSWTA